MTAPALTSTTVESVVVAPVPESNQVDAVGRRSRNEIAHGVVRAHRTGLQARRERDLISEKLLLHIDGSGDSQWAGDELEAAP